MLHYGCVACQKKEKGGEQNNQWNRSQQIMPWGNCKMHSFVGLAYQGKDITILNFVLQGQNKGSYNKRIKRKKNITWQRRF